METFVDLLDSADSKTVSIVLEAINNILNQDKSNP